MRTGRARTAIFGDTLQRNGKTHALGISGILSGWVVANVMILVVNYRSDGTQGKVKTSTLPTYS